MSISHPLPPPLRPYSNGMRPSNVHLPVFGELIMIRLPFDMHGPPSTLLIRPSAAVLPATTTTLASFGLPSIPRRAGKLPSMSAVHTFTLRTQSPSCVLSRQTSSTISCLCRRTLVPPLPQHSVSRFHLTVPTSRRRHAGSSPSLSLSTWAIKR